MGNWNSLYLISYLHSILANSALISYNVAVIILSISSSIGPF